VAIHGEVGNTALALRLFHGDTLAYEGRFFLADQLQEDGAFSIPVPLPEGIGAWSPAQPTVYDAELSLVDGSNVVDALSRPVGFRRVAAHGRSIELNGEPIVIRGVLHWGYEPPFYAPNAPASQWRREFHHIKSLGFNLVKACLWVPPQSFFDTALAEGLLVWQEYPAWHPDFSAKYRDDLLREYDEFFHLDRSRTAIAVRSLTCETGRSSDAKVVEALFKRCKDVTGAGLVEDDSSWISWNRFHDFYDDHPYGNCGSWVGRLKGFEDYIEKHGPKPFLLGEAVTSDTWIDLDGLERALSGTSRWWEPHGVAAQRKFEKQLPERIGREGASRLIADSYAYGLSKRKYQIETFRRMLPRAGYVSSVMRDFRLARMGFFDDRSIAKWTPEQWRWHCERMLVFDDPAAARSISAERFDRGRLPRLLLAGGGTGGGTLELSLELSTCDDGGYTTRGRFHTSIRASWASQHLLAASPLFGDLELGALRAPEDRPARVRLSAELAGASNAWDLWVFPKARPASDDDEVRVASEVDPETLDWVAAGGRLLLLPGGKGGLKSAGLPFYRGALYAPARHPLFERVPRDALLELQGLDLDGPVFSPTELLAGFAPIVGFWDTHDLDEVRDHGLLLEARVGKGRVVACALGLSEAPVHPLDARDGEPDAPNPARAWLRASLLRYLRSGPAPAVTLPERLVRRWRDAIVSRRSELGGTWLLEPDPKDRGLAGGWAKPGFDDSKWMKAHTGAHWETIGLPHYDGVAWYRKHFDAPDYWKPGQPLWAVFDGVDDSYVLFVNGQRIAAFGDPATGETVWLIRTSADIGPKLRAKGNVMALRVVDHQGAGGLHRKVWLSTTKLEATELVNH